MAHRIGLTLWIIGLVASVLISHVRRRTPVDGWFVLRGHRFEVPRAPLWKDALAPLLLCGSWALGGEVAGYTSAADRAALLGAAVAVVWMVPPTSAPVALTPHGVRIWRWYGFRTIPWQDDRRPDSARFRSIAMAWETLDDVIEHYTAHPEDRPKIGTGVEYDRLVTYVRGYTLPDPVVRR